MMRAPAAQGRRSWRSGVMRGAPGVEAAGAAEVGARGLAVLTDELAAVAGLGEAARWAARMIQVWPKNWYLGLG